MVEADGLGALRQALAAAGDRLVVLLGPGVSDQAAVPLPFVSNAVSPSLTALLRRDLARRGGEDLAARLLAQAGAPDDPRAAPARLRLLCAALAEGEEATAALLRGHLDGKRPGVAHRALAALAGAGRVRRLVSTCWDPLLEWTLARRGVAHDVAVGAAAPTWGARPALWRLGLPALLADPVLPEDAAAALGGTAAAALATAAEGGALLLVGHSGLLDPLVAAAVAAARDAGRLPHGVFWLADDDQLAEDGPRALADAAGARFHLLRRPETADLLAELCAAEGLALGDPPPPWTPSRALERLGEVLDLELDIQGALELVPVINLYEPVIERVPPVRVRSALLLALVLALAFAAWNAWEWRGREAVVAGHRAALDGLAQDLGRDDTIEGTLEVARRTDELLAAVEATAFEEGEATVGAVLEASQARLAAVRDDALAFRDEALLLARARRGLERALRFDERFNRFNRFPDPAARALSPGAEAPRGRDAVEVPLPAALAARPAVVLVADRELTLEVLLKRAALADLAVADGPLPLLVELSTIGPGGVAALAREALARAAGVDPAQVAPDLVERLLERGALRVLGRRPGRGGALRRALFAVERFRAAAPATPVVVAAARLEDGLALPLPALEVAPLRADDALAYAGGVAPRLREALLARRDLLAAASDPLALSVAVDHFLSSGRLPASRGLLLDAFVTEYLEQQVRAGVGARLGLRAFGLKRLLAELGEWAAFVERRAQPLPRDEAVRRLAELLDRDEPYGVILSKSPPDPQALRRMAHESGGPSVAALAAGEEALEALLATGLLEEDPAEATLRFATDELRAYACAVYLRTASAGWAELDSDDQPGAVALWAQLQPAPAAPFTDRTKTTALDPQYLETVWNAARTLGGVETPDPALEAAVLEAALPLLDHPTAFRRAQGARILRGLGTARAARALLARARAAEPTADRAARAAEALEVLGDGHAPREVAPELAALAADAGLAATARAAAARAAGRAGGPRERAALAALARDPAAPAAARTAAAEAVVAAGGAAADEVLAAAAGDAALRPAALVAADAAAPAVQAALLALLDAPAPAAGGEGPARGEGPAGRAAAAARLALTDAGVAALASVVAARGPGGPWAARALAGRRPLDAAALGALLDAPLALEAQAPEAGAPDAGAPDAQAGPAGPPDLPGALARGAPAARRAAVEACLAHGVAGAEALAAAARARPAVAGAWAPPAGPEAGLVAALGALGVATAPEVELVALAAARASDAGLEAVAARPAGALAVAAAATPAALARVEAWAAEGRLAADPAARAAVLAGLPACAGDDALRPRARRVAADLLAQAQAARAAASADAARAAAARDASLAVACVAGLWDEAQDPAPLVAALAEVGPGAARLDPAVVLPAFAAVRDPRVLAALVELALAVGTPAALRGQADAPLEPGAARGAIEALAAAGDLEVLRALYPLGERLAQGDERVGAAAARELLLALARGVSAVLGRLTPTEARIANALLERFGAPWRNVLLPLVDGSGDDALGSAAAAACVRLQDEWLVRRGS